MSVRGSILIVEDEGLLLDIIATEVEEQGFTVIRAMTAEAALDVLRGPLNIDLLFTDIRLPGPMNGWRLAETALKLRSDLPVMYATGFTDENPQGIDRTRFFQKPYRIASVIRAIQEIVAA